MKKTKKKNYVLIALVVLLLAISIGYAAFTATLTISGTAEGKGKWDVKFTSAKITDGAGKVTAITPSENGTKVTVNVELAAPGDAVTLETVITNSGTIPAKLTGFTAEYNDATKTTIDGTSHDGLIISLPADNKINAGDEGEKIAANGGTCTNQFGIKWDENVNKLEKKEFTITFTYKQDTQSVTVNPTHTHSS